MKLVVAFFRLIRTLNLVFIALTQFLFQYCIVVPTLQGAGLQPLLNHYLFLWLMLASVSIAAAGYIINDYFDLNIDRVNKPERLVIDKIIRRRWAIIWHFLLSGIGMLSSIYVGWKINNFIIPAANIACVALLLLYSTTFKKKLLSGNIIISMLTGWVVLILYVCEMPRTFQSGATPELVTAIARILRLAVVYTGFAFIISLIREVLKDIEDMPGDEKYGCRTMPVVWGVQGSKIFIATWLIVLAAAIVVLQFYFLQFKWWLPLAYAFLTIIVPLLLVFRKLFSAHLTEDFHRLSNRVKLIMLTGILSMVFFKFYS